MLLSRFLPDAARQTPSAPALRMADEVWTYAQLDAGVSRLAGGLVERGVQPGDRVALLGHPCCAVVELELAAIAVGAVPMVVSPRLALPEIQAVVRDADPTVFAYSGEWASHIPDIAPESADLRICLDAGADDPSLDWIAGHSVPLSEPYRGEPGDVALLIYTGGTTGPPRGVMHTHRSVGAWSGIRPPGTPLSPLVRMTFNLAHVSGQATLLASVSSGSCLVLSDNQRPTGGAAADLVEQYGIQGLGLTGSLFKEFVDLEDLQERHLDSLLMVVHAGAPTTPECLLKGIERLPHTVVLEAYGSTETGICCTVLNATACAAAGDKGRLSSVGTASGVAVLRQTPPEVRIIDAHGNDIAGGEIGEVVCRGPGVSAGYWRNPAATVEAIPDGWLRTGDLGRLDGDRYLYLVDRKKDMVIIGASNVYSAEVEVALGSHPAIREAAVIGTPLPGEGEEITAVVVLEPGASLTLDEARACCDGRIAGYKLPTRLEIVERIPRTDVGKVNKVELRSHFWQGRTRRIN